jgi:hypothetical protein
MAEVSKALRRSRGLVQGPPGCGRSSLGSIAPACSAYDGQHAHCAYAL